MSRHLGLLVLLVLLAPAGVAGPIGKPPRAAGAIRLVWVMSVPAGVQFTRSEVTVAQYEACVKAGRCSRPMDRCDYGRPDRLDHPVACVTWGEATAFCAFAGGRLPTEDEWYAEASDGGKRTYAWGNDPVSCDYTVWAPEDRDFMRPAHDGCGRGSTWPVCSKPLGNSVSGLCDMTGNVFEWTSSCRDGLFWSGCVIRGGNYLSPASSYLRTSRRLRRNKWYEHAGQGFRCVRDIPAKP